MSDQEKIKALSAKVEDLLVIVGKVSEDLKTVAAGLKALTVAPAAPAAAPPPPKPTTTPPPPPTVPTPKPQSTPAPATQPAPTSETKQRSLEDIRMSFTEDLEVRLAFEDKGEYIIIKPKQFLGSDNFAKIASQVRGMGGEYISAGKDSHFRVPKKKA